MAKRECLIYYSGYEISGIIHKSAQVAVIIMIAQDYFTYVGSIDWANCWYWLTIGNHNLMTICYTNAIHNSYATAVQIVLATGYRILLDSSYRLSRVVPSVLWRIFFLTFRNKSQPWKQYRNFEYMLLTRNLTGYMLDIWFDLIRLSHYFQEQLSWMAQCLSDDNSTLVEVMAWWCQETIHYLSQFIPSFMSPTVVARCLLEQWRCIVNENCSISSFPQTR